MASAWAHLPNAALIDRIQRDFKARPVVWHAAWVSVHELNDRPTRDEAWSAAWMAACESELHAAREVVIAMESASGWRPCVALIAWPEDSAAMLDMPVDAVRLLAASGHPPAMIMLPACIVFNGDRHE